MNVLSRLTPRPNGDGSTPVNHKVVAMVREGTAGWSPAHLQSLVDSGEVPTQYVDLAVRHLAASPGLLAVQLPEFLAACRVARPDLYPILATPAGSRWLEAVSAELARALFSRGLGLLGLGL